MIDAFELYEELCGSVNTQQGGHVRPDRNFIQWVNQVSLLLYEQKFANWGKSQKIVDDMSKPFLTSVNIQVGPAGIVLFPENYGHFSSARYFTTTEGKVVPMSDLALFDCCGKNLSGSEECPAFMDPGVWEAIQSQEKAGKLLQMQESPALTSGLKEIPIEIISNDRWGSVLNHRLNGPSLSRPKMTQFEKGFKVQPAEVTFIVLDYLRMPKPASFEYTMAPADPLTGRGDYLVYNPIKSEKLEWSQLMKNEILNILDKKYGKFIREDFIWQTSESDRKQSV